MELPALNFLGYGLDLCTAIPWDIGTAACNVKKNHRLINIDRNVSKEQTIPIAQYSDYCGSWEYHVPDSVLVSTDVCSVQSDYQTFISGRHAAKAFTNDKALKQYFSISGCDEAVASSIQSLSLTGTHQYAFYSLRSVSCIVTLTNADNVNESIITRITDLPTFQEKPDNHVVELYKSFFRSFGSHIVTSTIYGALFQLIVKVPRHATDPSKFAAHVNQAFNGMPKGVADPSIESDPFYQKFKTHMERTIAVQGGKTMPALRLTSGSFSDDVFDEWKGTIRSLPNLIHLGVLPLWESMKAAHNPMLRERAKDIEAAFMFVTRHRQEPCRTHVTLCAHTDWAEFGLLTQNAYIEKDAITWPESTVIFNNKIRWVNQTFRMVLIRFVIVNDGSPIDFYTSHGNNRNKGESGGYVKILMDDCEYLNSDITGDGINCKFFLQV
ncbi:hypothetical protein WOLCODRAFT_162003 [Wolfiporia cocos MD-104 SS10]|uniref:MACPF domain-containing protein n=1 Tax=Wolfiporia cocos (strain MD-104) TaxID=742152 RepID=A0A2H3JME7_WOLCO|nr:hypothetical protein WOLCODRAFT_162003 [Wolfiporia cocos MD-104 SS10]